MVMVVRTFSNQHTKHHPGNPMDVSQPPPVRVTVLLAKAAPKAVIIIRKRAKLFHIVQWDYEKNEIERGSWFKGNIYVDRCDVSFDGKHLVYFALGPSKGVLVMSQKTRFPWLGNAFQINHMK